MLNSDEQTLTDLDLRRSGWPWPLRKAVTDAYSYALKLRDGTVVRFESADPDSSGLFATLHDPEVLAPSSGEYVVVDHSTPNGTQDFSRWLTMVSNQRGLVVRVADIVWCCDYPA